MKYFFLFLFIATTFSSKLAAQITQKQINVFLNDTAVRSGHVGISIYEPATQKYLYNYNAEKNFTPSSNVKLFTLYAGMKYLGDSLIGIRYLQDSNRITIYPTGDPTLLHNDFKNQPVVNFLSSTSKELWAGYSEFKGTPWGNGWAWNDYADDYMAERSVFPIYGNTLSFNLSKNYFTVLPKFDSAFFINYDNIGYNKETSIKRNISSNNFMIHPKKNVSENFIVPFITSEELSYRLLSNKIKKSIISDVTMVKEDSLKQKARIIYSQPTDSLFRPMMHNSDNFFAEQTLLMVSNEKLGYMSDENIIDTLLKTDFKDLTTKPRWVDGCGLSRYNLFSPKDFVFLLDKMKNEFGMERLKGILTTGGQGTLKGYYDNSVGFIYAKTGSMSNNVSLSGYLFTKKNKMLIFSVQINSFSGSGRAGRRAIEKMLQQIRENN
jgi:serine-type D-Ala-D-Ala carboxypeptidase/endopeptidase (penicillin-binding protein 4)